MNWGERFVAMIPMRSWKSRKIDVLTGVILDPLNVRLGYPDGTPQDEIIFDLFKNEDVLDLVESIAKVGLLEHEFPIVLERHSELVVVEGNRRIAALKAIQNPLLVPDFHSRISSIISLIPDRTELRKIQVRQAPSQEDADQLIAALHTGKPRRPWTAPRRAEFFQAKVDEGKTLAELIESYPTVDVREYVGVAQLIRCFRSAQFSSQDAKDFLESRRFPLNTLARLYENSEFLEFMQVSINPKDSVATVSGSFDRFSALIEKIVVDIKQKKSTPES